MDLLVYVDRWFDAPLMMLHHNNSKLNIFFWLSYRKQAPSTVLKNSRNKRSEREMGVS